LSGSEAGFCPQR